MADSKREEFRKYLDQSKILDVLSTAMVHLEKEETFPEDPLAYIRNEIHAEQKENIDKLLRENQDLKGRIAWLQREIFELEQARCQ